MFDLIKYEFSLYTVCFSLKLQTLYFVTCKCLLWKWRPDVILDISLFALGSVKCSVIWLRFRVMGVSMSGLYDYVDSKLL